MYVGVWSSTHAESNIFVFFFLWPCTRCRQVGEYRGSKWHPYCATVNCKCEKGLTYTLHHICLICKKETDHKNTKIRFYWALCARLFYWVGAVTSGAIEWRNKIAHDGSKPECTCGPYLPPILAFEAACIGKANMGHLWRQQARFYGPPLPAHHSPMWGPHGYTGQVEGGPKWLQARIGAPGKLIVEQASFTHMGQILQSQFILNLKSSTVGCKACHTNTHRNVGVRLAKQTMCVWHWWWRR